MSIRDWLDRVQDFRHTPFSLAVRDLFIYYCKVRIEHITAFVIPIVEHWLEQEGSGTPTMRPKTKVSGQEEERMKGRI